MKTIKATFLALSLSLSSLAMASGTTCKFVTGDVGEVVGQGPSHHEAFKDAVRQCVDRRISAYEVRQPGSVIPEDRLSLFIDDCANLSCGR